MNNETTSLKDKLIQKEEQIDKLLDKIDRLEQNLMTLEESVDKQEENFNNPILTLNNIKIDEQEKEIRRLKSNLDHIRKQNLELKPKLKDTSIDDPDIDTEHHVIRIEEHKKTLEEMVDEIQTSLNKKSVSMKNLEATINKIKNEIARKDRIIKVLKDENSFMETFLKQKDSEIKDLKESVLNLELLYSKTAKTGHSK
ncbi:MAG: hypothetical protein EU543_00585 [Promethearchaeota archaeon]|nr:MAG: hypothetical protein EU543_00585 [Candidatus Lokiarchaeota archaeon]